MTCVIGLVHDDTVYIGGDSLGVEGWSYSKVVRADQKVFKREPMIMGFTTSFRMGQLLRYSLDIPAMFEDRDTYEFMVNDFITAVRECLKTGGYIQKKDEVERGGEFLVGFRGRLFRVEGDFQVGEPILSYSAIGSGAAYALGALFCNGDKQPEDRIYQALNAAAEFNAGVGRPFHIVHL